MVLNIRGRHPLLLSLSFSLLLFAGFVKTTNGFDFCSIDEATVDDIQRAFNGNKLSSRQLVEFYLRQIDTLNPLLRSVLEVNPDVLDEADKADLERQRRQKHLTGPLHGIPVLLKDSIATKDKLNTTAGSYALLGSVVPRDAFVVERLRKAGALILGKASLTEWYSLRSPLIPDGWCARGGQAVVTNFFFPLQLLKFLRRCYCFYCHCHFRVDTDLHVPASQTFMRETSLVHRHGIVEEV